MSENTVSGKSMGTNHKNIAKMMLKHSGCGRQNWSHLSPTSTFCHHNLLSQIHPSPIPMSPSKLCGLIFRDHIVFSNFRPILVSLVHQKFHPKISKFWIKKSDFLATWPWIFEFFFGQFIENNKLKINKNWFESTSHEIDFSRIKVESHP